MIRREDYLVPEAGGKFNAEEYDAHPEKYRSIFAEKVGFLMLFSIIDLSHNDVKCGFKMLHEI